MRSVVEKQKSLSLSLAIPGKQHPNPRVYNHWLQRENISARAERRVVIQAPPGCLRDSTPENQRHPGTSKNIHKYSDLSRNPSDTQTFRSVWHVVGMSLARASAWGFFSGLFYRVSRASQTTPPYHLHLAATQKKQGQRKQDTVLPFPKMETKPQTLSQLPSQLHSGQKHQTRTKPANPQEPATWRWPLTLFFPDSTGIQPEPIQRA